MHYSQLDLSLGVDDYFLETIAPDEVHTSHGMEIGDNKS
jgi:hypothetical protein